MHPVRSLLVLVLATLLAGLAAMSLQPGHVFAEGEEADTTTSSGVGPGQGGSDPGDSGVLDSSEIGAIDTETVASTEPLTSSLSERQEALEELQDVLRPFLAGCNSGLRSVSAGFIGEGGGEGEEAAVVSVLAGLAFANGVTRDEEVTPSFLDDCLAASASPASEELRALHEQAIEALEAALPA